PIGPLAVAEPGERLRVREVQAAVAFDPDHAAQLPPASGTAEVDLDGASVSGRIGTQDRAPHEADDAGTGSVPVEDGAGVQEQHRLEQRRLYVLAVPGGLPLDQRRAGTQHREEGRGDTRQWERRPDRTIPRDQTLLRAGAG